MCYKNTGRIPCQLVSSASLLLPAPHSQGEGLTPVVSRRQVLQGSCTLQHTRGTMRKLKNLVTYWLNADERMELVTSTIKEEDHFEPVNVPSRINTMD